MSNHVSVDFETFYSKKLKYGLKQMIAEQYCRHDLFDPYLISVSDGAACWSGHPQDFNWSALEGKLWVSHNRYFDNTVYNEMVRRGLAPQVQRAGWDCTANLTSFVCNRRALKDSVEYLYKASEADVDKSYRDVADNRPWSQMTPDQREHMMRAGRADALWCWRLWKDYGPKWPEMERDLSNITIDQGMRGVQIDVALLNQQIMDVHEMLSNTEKLIPWIAGADDSEAEWEDYLPSSKRKPTSTKCIAEQCRRAKIPGPPVKSDDEEGYEEWETEHCLKHPWIKALSAWRSLNKTYQSLVTIKARLRSDGTLPFGLKYFGAHTGRWAAESKINFQNMRKKPILGNEHKLVELDDIRIDQAIGYHDEHGKWPDWVSCVVDFRALIIPRPGFKMITSDLSQIEPRVLAWVCGNHAMLKLVAEGMSVYESFARSTMGYTKPGKMDKRSDEYKRIKIQVLQLGYQAGWRKFISTALKEGGLDLTKDDPEWIEYENPFSDTVERKSGYGTTAKAIVDNFRAQNPLIVGLWGKLDDAFRRSQGEQFSMLLPSGRKLRYDAVRMAVKIIPDPDRPKVPKRITECTADVGGFRKAFYGGKLTENLVQGIARDVFGWHVVNLHKKGLPQLFSSHDEAVMEVEQSVTAKDVENEMSKCPPWLPGCPIAAEAKEVAHYTK